MVDALFNLFKKSSIILLALMILSLMMGFAFAGDNFTEEVSLANSNIDVEVNSSNSPDNTNGDVLNLENNEHSDILTSSNLTDPNKRIYESTVVEYGSLTKEYTAGYVTYPVKAYDIVTYGGVRYNDPKYNSIVKLKVSGKVYSGRIGSDGVALVKLPNLSLGNHNVEIYVEGRYSGSSSIKIVKSATKVYAPKKYVMYGGNGYYNIRVVDSNNVPARDLSLNVKVDTGGKRKTYHLKTNVYGVARLKTYGLTLGTHKLTVKTKDKRYFVNRVSRIVVGSVVYIVPEKLSASASNKVVRYKGNVYFSINVKNSYGYAVKGILLEVDVFTGRAYKTNYIKTDSKGVAKLRTNGLSLGTHNVIVRSADDDYALSKAFKIVVKKSVASDKIQATKLMSLQFYQKANGKYYAKLSWSSKKGTSYQILKKSKGSFEVISTVKANSNQMTFTEKVTKDASCTYSVREIIKNKNMMLLGSYDVGGLKLLSCPKVKVNFDNMKAHIYWSKVSGATNYIIFRKVGREGTFKAVAIVGADKLNYNDYYYKSPNGLSEILTRGVFINPDSNSLFYTVRACNVKNVDGTCKKSYSPYLLDGDFNLEAPAIVSLTNTTIKWGTVPNADGYAILKKQDSDGVWVIVAQVDKKNTLVQSKNIRTVDNGSYYTVQAYAIKNGKTVYSGYDVGFSLMDSSQNNTKYKLLFFGDSIMYGFPYSSVGIRYMFSMPNRISQLLGCVYYNPSTPGVTYHSYDDSCADFESDSRYRMIPDVVEPVSVGKAPMASKICVNSKNSEGISKTRIEDYNIVVLSAGTNDYITSTKLGSLNSIDVTTFNGALNHILSKIESASKKRVKRGLEPIKVVFVDLFYSDYVYVLKKIENRDKTKNKIGLTLKDYQNALDNMYKKWKAKSKYLTFYRFNTRSYNIVNSNTCSYMSADNLHFTKFTYAQYGNALAKFLSKKVFAK